MLFAHLTRSSLHHHRTHDELVAVVARAKVVRHQFTEQEMADWLRSSPGDAVEEEVVEVDRPSESRSPSPARRRDRSRSAPRRRRNEGRRAAGSGEELALRPPSPPRNEIVPAARPPAAQEMVQVPGATLHAIHACLEQAANALGHAQNLCNEAQRAFGEEQAHVRIAMGSIRDALRNAGYFF